MSTALERRQATADTFEIFGRALGDLTVIREALATNAEVEDESLRTELEDMGTRLYALRARLDALARRQSKLDRAAVLGEMGRSSRG